MNASIAERRLNRWRSAVTEQSASISLDDFQSLIRRMYLEKDRGAGRRRHVHVADGGGRRVGGGACAKARTRSRRPSLPTCWPGSRRSPTWWTSTWPRPCGKNMATDARVAANSSARAMMPGNRRRLGRTSDRSSDRSMQTRADTSCCRSTSEFACIVALVCCDRDLLQSCDRGRCDGADRKIGASNRARRTISRSASGRRFESKSTAVELARNCASKSRSPTATACRRPRAAPTHSCRRRRTWPRRRPSIRRSAALASAIQIALVDGETRHRSNKRCSPMRRRNRIRPSVALPATAELIVSLGSDAVRTARGVSESRVRRRSTRRAGRRVEQRRRSADRVVRLRCGRRARDLGRRRRAVPRTWPPMTTRFDALRDGSSWAGGWSFCAAAKCRKSCLAEGGPLAPLLPGQVRRSRALAGNGPAGAFRRSRRRRSRSRGHDLRVPRLVDVEGNIEVYAGRQADRFAARRAIAARLGRSHVCRASISAQPPLADWPGRTAFFRRCCGPILANDRSERRVATTRDARLQRSSGALRQQLGRSFAGVVPIGFPLVAVLAIVYLLLLGPLDYLLVNRWLRRPLVAWITFPLIVLAFSARGAGRWRNGARRPARASIRLELVDIDTIAGRARGTLWATLYSPQARAV